MKKLFSLFLSLIISVGTMFAEIVQIGDLYYNLDYVNKKAEVTADYIFFSYIGDIVIPSSVSYNSTTYSVTSIGGSAFSGCTSLTSITIPNSVTSIGGSAFAGCTSLTSINIPNSVTSIGQHAFNNCTSLTSIMVASGNSKYDSRNNCNAIIETATNSLVVGCKNTIIPYSVTNIGNYAFYNYTGLTSVTIPISVTSIGNYAFYNCTGLTSVTISNSVTSIGDYAFEGCTGLPVIDNVRYADTYLIEAVDKTLSSYTIKEGTRFIGLAAFARCSGFTSIEIPNSVISIGGSAFAFCTSLTTINVANDNPNFCSLDGIIFNKDKTTLVIFPGGQKEEYTIPNSVTSIGEGAFFGCTGLTSITMSNSVKSIGGGAFISCTSLTSITCKAVNPPICGESVFYNVSRSIPLYVPANSISKYKATSPWSEWGDNIKPIQASEKVVIEPSAEPTGNSVVIDWPKADGAAAYAIEIKKNGVLVCTLEFNESGQLLSIDFAAPDRNGKVRNAQEALQTSTGWQYTINGLDPNTEYTYTVIAKKSDDSEVYNKTVPFKTKDSATALDQTSQESIVNSQKLLINGQILIFRGEKTYTLTGQEVK